MSTLFNGINLALRAVLSHQQAVQVIEHNVANANTPGYRRQQAVLTAAPVYGPPGLIRPVVPGQMGTGVMVDRIQRFNLEFFDGRYRRETADASRWAAARDVLKQVEATLAETGTDGLMPKLDAFWTGWQTLSSDPSNTALRADLRERSLALADAVNRRAVALNTLRQDQDLAIRQRVEEINTLASGVARLNAEIARVQSVGDAPNDLLDERDRQVDRLAELAGAQGHLQPNGEMLVSIGGHALVVGSTPFTLAVTSDLSNSNLARIDWNDGQPFGAPRGELAGLLDARDRVIPAQQTGLDSFAAALMSNVNALHQTGYGLNNATGLAFFTGTDAMSMRVSANITDPASGLQNIAAATAAGSPGDGNLARQISDLQRSLLLTGGTATLHQFYTAQVGALGLEGKQAENSARDRGLVAEALSNQRESFGGVSLDEEAAQLVQSQRAYQAAMRLMTTVDDMLDRVINGMGRVGL
jgi:flagellar hook-associated protein 1 FlgK